MTKKVALVVSICSGMVIALVFRVGLVAVTTDLSYVRFLDYETVAINGDPHHSPVHEDIEHEDAVHADTEHAIGWKYVGKTILSSPMSGFPFSRFDDCKIEALGSTRFVPRCAHQSTLGELASIFNFIIWSGCCYGVYLAFSKQNHTHSSHGGHASHA